MLRKNAVETSSLHILKAAENQKSLDIKHVSTA